MEQMEAELLIETGKTWRDLMNNKEISQELTELLKVAEEEKERRQRYEEAYELIQFCKDHDIPVKLGRSVGFLLEHIKTACFISIRYKTRTLPSDKFTPEELLDTSAQIIKSLVLENTTRAERKLLYEKFYRSPKIISSLSNSPDKMEQLIGRADQHIMDILCEN